MSGPVFLVLLYHMCHSCSIQSISRIFSISPKVIIEQPVVQVHVRSLANIPFSLMFFLLDLKVMTPSFFLCEMVFAATVRLKTFAGWRIESVNDCGAREVTVGDLLLWAQCAFESAYIAVKLQTKQEQRTERITAKTDCTNEIYIMENKWCKQDMPWG